jgi:hypothetical protein
MSELNALLAQLQAGMSPTTGGAAFGGSRGASPAVVQDLMKALTASNYETDVASLTGGGALGIQSLDKTMKAVVQEQKHFVLFRRLANSNATNIVDEYVRKNGIGGFLGGSTNTQMGVVRSATGDYSREIGRVKFLMTLRQVGYVGTLVNNIASLEAEEEINGGLQLLTDAEYLLFHGNADANPAEFDGIFKLLDDEITAGNVASDHIVDLDGQPLDSVEPFAKLNAAVAKFGNWGYTTDCFLTQDVQTDLNMGLDPAFRWQPEGQNAPIHVGQHVAGIRLQNGVLSTNLDTFISYDGFPMAMPFEVNWSALATANTTLKPASVTASASSSDASSRFTTTRAGDYIYAVAGISGTGAGQSDLAFVSGAVTVAAGKKVVLTITKSSGNTETGYAIYRGKQDSASVAPADLRLVAVVKKAGNTTEFTDLNHHLPGTTRVPVLNLEPGADAIGWRQFQSMTKIPLPFGIGLVPQYSWFQMLFGYLRVTKPKHVGYVKNILPTHAQWRPHTGE